jgi:hypothetical protein
MVVVTLVLVVVLVVQLFHQALLVQDALTLLVEQFIARAELDLKLAHRVLLELMALETVGMELAQAALELQLLGTQLVRLLLFNL